MFLANLEQVFSHYVEAAWIACAVNRMEKAKKATQTIHNVEEGLRIIKAE